jgi:cellulose synthase/poly-beta-1,6-N-acetylglucosamine synthase-like glycosyltransferase
MSAAASIVLGIEFVFLLYFLGLQGGYFGLNLISLFALPRYMQLRVISELPQSHSGFDPPISVIVPAYNEAATIVSSIRSLLQLSYSEFELVVVNDGSKDDTLEVLKGEFKLAIFPEAYRIRLHTKPVRAIYLSTIYPNLRVIDKENGGKADSMNTGINAARYPLFCVIDADSILQRDSLQMAVQPFLEDPKTIACGATIRVANGCQVRGGFLERTGLPSNPLALFQVAEYLRAFLFGRLGWSSVDALLIVSGAFGVFHKETVVSVGGFNRHTLGEDMELIMRLHRVMTERRVPYRIAFIPDPVCWTEAPENLRILRKQRVRWQHGLGDCIMLNRSLLFKRGSGAVGWVALPFFLIFEWLGPLLEVAGYVFVVVNYFLGLLSFASVLLFLLLAIGMGMLLSVSSLLLEELSFRTYPKMRHILLLFVAAIAENLGYRQLNSYWRLEGLVKWMAGHKPSWGEMTRTASWLRRAPNG